MGLGGHSDSLFPQGVTLALLMGFDFSPMLFDILIILFNNSTVMVQESIHGGLGEMRLILSKSQLYLARPKDDKDFSGFERF